MQMPALDPDILRRRGEIVAALKAIVPGEGVIDDLDGMRPFECDALSAYRKGIEVAEKKGDKQAAKEMVVFARRLEKSLASGGASGGPS